MAPPIAAPPPSMPRPRQSKDKTSAVSSVDLGIFLVDLDERERAPQQNRNEKREDRDFFQRTIPERCKAFEEPNEQSADCGTRITDEAANDRADESLEPDD